MCGMQLTKLAIRESGVKSRSDHSRQIAEQSDDKQFASWKRTPLQIQSLAVDLDSGYLFLALIGDNRSMRIL